VVNPRLNWQQTQGFVKIADYARVTGMQIINLWLEVTPTLSYLCRLIGEVPHCISPILNRR